jgi:hypothetical protein
MQLNPTEEELLESILGHLASLQTDPAFIVQPCQKKDANTNMVIHRQREGPNVFRAGSRLGRP